jgi:uncharacterized damage-inducible protein DinB
MQVLLELIHGHGAHVDATACVTVPFDLAGRTPDGLPHSIAQLVGHMTYWMEYELARIGGTTPQYPEHASLSWPVETRPESEDGWSDAIRRFAACLQEMERLVRAGPDALGRPVPLTDPVHSRQADSLEALLWQTVVHNSYHLGQVAQVRRALGAWPPEGGGDTW